MKHHLPLLVTLLFCWLSFSQCASVRNQKQIERNKETVRIWFEEGWNNNQNEELIERCFDPNWRDGNPLRADQVAGYEGMRQLIRSYKQGATDDHFTITHLFADKDMVSIRYEVVAKHTGTLFGIPPTGREFTSTGLVIYEMKDGRIEVSWQELDLSGIIRQLSE